MYLAKAIIFDMDGLMFDTERLGLDAWVYTGKKMNLNITKELALETVGVSWTLTKRIFFREFNEFDFDNAQAVWQEYINNYIEKNGIPIKPGLFDLLSFLEEIKLKKAIATSSLHVGALFYLKKAGIDKRFNVVVTGEMVTHGKPAPDIYFRAAELLDVNPRECIVLEDSVSGIKAAHAAKMMPIMTPDLIAADKQIESLLYAKFDSLTDVIRLLKNLFIK